MSFFWPSKALVLARLPPRPQQLKFGRMGRKLRRRVWNFGRRPLHRHRSFPRTLPPARVSVCLQPSPAAAATNQVRYFDSSRLVRLKDSSLVRNGSPAGVSQVLPGEPFVSREQVSPVSTVTRETDAMEKEETLDGGHFLSLGCRSQLQGCQRARGPIFLG